MKLSKIFHTLYFSVLAMPIAILPIFALAVRSDNNFTPIEVQQQINKVVDFNQFSKLTNSTDVSFNDDIITYVASTNVSNGNRALTTSFPYPSNHKILLKADLLSYSGTFNSWYLNFNIDHPWYNSTMSNNNNPATENTKIFSYTTTSDDCICRFVLYGTWSQGFSVSVRLQSFDLTKMYGLGNEPTTIEQFNYYFPNDYYDFTLSEQQSIPNYIQIYNDQDVGSQMVYTVYNSLDKYFNLTDLSIFNGIYNWFNINLFSGTAPLWFFIFFDLLLYWLMVSLFWLIFDVMIYVPMVAHRWLDKGALE